MEKILSDVERHAVAVLNGESQRAAQLREALRRLRERSGLIESLEELLDSEDGGSDGELAARALSLILRLRSQR